MENKLEMEFRICGLEQRTNGRVRVTAEQQPDSGPEMGVLYFTIPQLPDTIFKEFYFGAKLIVKVSA